MWRALGDQRPHAQKRRQRRQWPRTTSAPANTTGRPSVNRAALATWRSRCWNAPALRQSCLLRQTAVATASSPDQRRIASSHGLSQPCRSASWRACGRWLTRRARGSCHASALPSRFAWRLRHNAAKPWTRARRRAQCPRSPIRLPFIAARHRRRRPTSLRALAHGTPSLARRRLPAARCAASPTASLRCTRRRCCPRRRHSSSAHSATPRRCLTPTSTRGRWFFCSGSTRAARPRSSHICCVAPSRSLSLGRNLQRTAFASCTTAMMSVALPATR